MADRFLTVAEVADRLSITAWTVRRLCALGQLPATKVGRGWRVSEELIEDLIAGRRTDIDLTVAAHRKGKRNEAN